MIGWLKNIISKKESIDDLEPSIRHSQVALDTESRAFLFRESDLLPPFALSGYLNSYLTDDLAATIIDSDTRLTVSPVECVSEDDALCEFVNEFNRRVELVNVLFEVVRDCNLYGFSAHEIVGNASQLIDSTEILGLKRLDPRFVVIQKNEFGRIVRFKQRPSFSLATSTVTPGTAPFPFERKLDPQSIIYVTNTSPFTSYGQSLLQAIDKQLDRRNDLLDAAALAARNHANPLIHGSYESPSEVKENRDDIKNQLNALKKAGEAQQENNSKYIFTAGKGTHKFSPIGHTTIPDLTPLIEHVTTAALVT